MSIYAIPVDIANPSQVFACMGFLEAAEALIGATEARFDWQGGSGAAFYLQTEEEINPFLEVLRFLTDARAIAVAPRDWLVTSKITDYIVSETFPISKPDATALPIELTDSLQRRVLLNHWADGSLEENFKLYSGNRSAQKIASDMLREIKAIWVDQHNKLLADPLNTLCVMGGSFNFDPRGGWLGLDVGYSINDLNNVKELEQKVVASPVVELMAAWGLQHFRPYELSLRKYRYAVWREWLPPQLARPALSCQLPIVDKRHFSFALDLSGKNKIIRYAIQENLP
jgi:CRISPR-associated protein Csb3